MKYRILKPGLYKKFESNKGRQLQWRGKTHPVKAGDVVDISESYGEWLCGQRLATSHRNIAQKSVDIFSKKVQGTDAASDKIDATDGAVKLATKSSIDLSLIKGTGNDGRIIKSDVQDVIDKRISEANK